MRIIILIKKYVSPETDYIMIDVNTTIILLINQRNLITVYTRINNMEIT